MLKKIGLQFILFLICMTFVTTVKAKHIIGGELTYKCLGVDPSDTTSLRYVFTLTMYRDCFGGGADFDDLAVIGFFYKNI